jgi:hypothetical protein
MVQPFHVPADRLSVALAEALADRGDAEVAIELLEAVHSEIIRLEKRLDWLGPHLLSLISDRQVRLGKKDPAQANLRAAVEAMENSYLKPPPAVLAGARARLALLGAPADVKPGGQTAPAVK